ncbi:MAG: GGDEF domain-containing protein [Eubacteriales bacterium]|nr:GGDEF domain-containing protein [Eubacteriales bacterium]
MSERVAFNEGSAEAVINEYMVIIKADNSFYSFIGGLYNQIFTRFLHPDDVKKLEYAIQQSGNKDEYVEILRIKDCDDYYHFMRVTVSEEENVEGSEKMYHLVFKDVDTICARNEVLRERIEYQAEYLSLIGSVMFSYDIDNDKMNVFIAGNSRQNLNFFEGPLEEWKALELAKGESDENRINDYDGLCMAIRSGEQSFTRSVSLKCNSDEKAERKIYKGRTITDSNGKKTVIGIINIVGKEDNVSYLQSVLTEEVRDPGTDLFNKKATENYARKLIDRKPDHSVTIAIIDVDDFKSINDTDGHMFGDEVLHKVADIIKNAVGNRGICGRIGGDEMFLVMEKLEDNESIRSVLRTIKNDVAFLYHNDPRNINKITCSIGSSTYPHDGKDYDTLFKIADKMLYLAKERGKDRYVIFHKDLHSQYIEQGKAIEQDDSAYYKYMKTKIVNDFIQEYMLGDSQVKRKALEKLAIAFEMDSIFLYDQENKLRLVMYGDEPVGKDNGDFLAQDNYIPDFREDGIKVIENIGFLERKSPEFYKTYKEMGIVQVMQFIVGARICNGNVCVTSFNRKIQHSKLPNIDAHLLAVAGNVIGEDYLRRKSLGRSV